MRLKPAALILATLLVAGCGGGESGRKDPDGSVGRPPPGRTKPPPPPPMVRQKAEPGVGKNGRGIGAGPMATPVRAYFRTRERIVFDMQVKPAVNLYKAEHGYFPKSQEEFTEKIIKKNGIKLPELPAGHRYVYEPKTGELVVESPGSSPLKN